uniref:hypothetical protein n=1 Tax=Halovivax sp. TaxID=1935978 RepID=UPI0025BE75FB
YYLGAELRPAEEVAICTADARYPLGEDRRLEDDVARALKRVFLLDCVVRTEGVYQYDLHERDELEPALPWSLAELYDAPLAHQLDRYFEVPFETLEPHLPRWPLTAHVPSTPNGVELLPFVVNELGIVREPRGTTVGSLSEFGGTEQPATVDAAGLGAFTRSAGPVRGRRAPPTDGATVVEPAVTDESIEHAWFGDRVPLGASKATVEGYQNQLERESRNESIEILVVCNDARMLDEHDVLDETYGSREVLPFDVTSGFGVSTDELARLLTEGGYDFLHYIGHATSDGLRCTDGRLDVRTLKSVDLGVFFLNACHSYEQGLALARRGAFGGVATLGDIVNEGAVESGGALARLLNLGFPLRGALEVVSEWTDLGEQYLIVGDGSTDIAQTNGGAPAIVSVDSGGDATHDVSFRVYPAKGFQTGSVTSPNLPAFEGMYLLPMHDVRMTVSDDDLRDYFTWTKTPVLLDGKLYGNSEVGPPQFLGHL